MSAIDRCHNLLIMSLNLNNIAILSIKGSDDCCIISVISNNEAIMLMQNTVWLVEHYKKSEKL